MNPIHTRKFFIFLPLLFLGFCKLASPKLTELRGQALGAKFYITYIVPSSGSTFERINSGRLNPDTIARDIQKIFVDIQNQTSLYQSDSKLIRINNHESNSRIKLSEPLGAMMAYALDLSKKSDGYYDITTGALSKLWAVDDISKAHYQPPKNTEIVKAMSVAGYRNLELRKERQGYFLTKKISGIKIDLASISAGYAADQIGHYFESHEISNYLIDVSGEVRASGSNQGRRWVIGVENPLAIDQGGDGNEHGKYIRKILLENRSLATSGVSKNFARYNDRRYSHIIDPHTGHPTVSALLSVTVIQNTCMEADAIATAIFAMGEARGYKFAEKYKIPMLMVIASGKKEPTVKINSAMKIFVVR